MNNNTLTKKEQLLNVMILAYDALGEYESTPALPSLIDTYLERFETVDDFMYYLLDTTAKYNADAWGVCATLEVEESLVSEFTEYERPQIIKNAQRVYNLRMDYNNCPLRLDEDRARFEKMGEELANVDTRFEKGEMYSTNDLTDENLDILNKMSKEIQMSYH